MLQGPGDLRRQFVVQAIDEVTDVVGDVADMQTFSPPVAGIEDFLEVIQDRDNRVILRQRTMAQVVDDTDFGIGLDDTISQARQLFFQAEVGSHDVASMGTNRGQRKSEVPGENGAVQSRERAVGWGEWCVRSTRTEAAVGHRM